MCILYTLVRACGWFLVVRPGEFRTPAEFGLKLCTRDDVEFAAIDRLVATAARLAMLGNCLRTLEITQITCNLTCVCVLHYGSGANRCSVRLRFNLHIRTLCTLN